MLQTAFDETIIGTELLPDGWNRTSVVGSDGVSLRYVLGGKLFILRCFNTDQQFIFNLLVSALSEIAFVIRPIPRYLEKSAGNSPFMCNLLFFLLNPQKKPHP